MILLLQLKVVCCYSSHLSYSNDTAYCTPNNRDDWLCGLQFLIARLDRLESLRRPSSLSRNGTSGQRRRGGQSRHGPRPLLRVHSTSRHELRRGICGQIDAIWDCRRRCCCCISSMMMRGLEIGLGTSLLQVNRLTGRCAPSHAANTTCTCCLHQRS